MAVLNNTWYVDSVSAAAVGTWVTLIVKAAGALIRATAPTAANERIFVATSVTGTTGASEPTWVVTKGGKTTDATVTWQECTGQAGVCGDLTNCPLSSAARSQTPALGLVIQNNAGTFLFICSTSGACGAGEPTYNTTAGQTTTDSSCTWTCLGAVGNFTAFQCAMSRLNNVLTVNWAAQGDTVFVGDDHAETQAAGLNLAPQTGGNVPTKILCADHTKHPPLAADLKTTATITTTGNNNLNLQGGHAYYYGITFQAGSGAVAAIMAVQSAGIQTFDTCSLQKLGTTGATGAIAFGSTATSQFVRLRNTTVKFGSTADGIVCPGGRVLWEDTPSAISGATIPTILFQRTASAATDMFVRAVDLSALGSGTLVGAAGTAVRYVFLNCKFGTAYVSVGTPATGAIIDIVACDSAASNLNYLVSRKRSEGSHTTAINPIRTSGATDGTTAVSWNITTTAICSWYLPFAAQPISIWNATTGTNRVVSIYGIINAAAVPNNDDIWFRLNYLGDSASPMASTATTTKATGLTANAAYSADTSAWDTGTTARANTTAYNVGDMIKVATNTGRVFFCTSAGTSAGSEPGGYATAVDGGSVTDSGATFRAGCRFVMSVTLSSPQPQKAGYMRTEIMAGLASTALWWIDPLIVLS